MVVKVDLETKARIQCLGDVWHCFMHWLMKEAIRQFVKQKEQQQEALRQEGIQAWEACQDKALLVNVAARHQREGTHPEDGAGSL